MFTITETILMLLVAFTPKTATEMGATSIARTMPRMRGHFKTDVMRKIAAFHFSHSTSVFRMPSVVRNLYHSGVRELDCHHSQRLHCTNLFMSDNSKENNEIQSINIPQMKKEITRLSLRTHKKIGKVSIRIQAAQEKLAKLRGAMDQNQEVDDALMEQLEQSPSEISMTEHQNDLASLQYRLQQLNWLEEQFNNPPLQKKSSLTSEEVLKLTEKNIGEKILQYVQELEINENEVAKNKRVEEDVRNKKSKKEMSFQQQQQTQGGRLPYRRYFTKGKTEIRVGKQATDNDVLSLLPEHRSGSHWWYHASGCAGSHVVLCTDEPSPSEEDVKDAASLAALKSKCIGQSVIKVSMTRARNVSKPPGAKPGLVQLNGDVKTITLRKDEVERRFERLEKTVLVN